MPFKMKPLSCDPARIKGMSERLIISHYENNYGGAVKRLKATIAISLALLGYLGASAMMQAAGSCSKECRDFHRACLKAHSQAACKGDYDICMKHCKGK